MLALLLVVLAVGTAGEGVRLVAPGLLAALVTAVAIDGPILRLREEEWVVPDGAIITALIVAMILSPREPWYVAAATCAIGVLAKYVARTKSANVFNPAALGLVATYYVFNAGQSWWGALPELPPVAIAVIFATGIFITQRVNKIPAVLAFLGTWFALATLATFTGPAAHVAELYRAPDLHAALFLAFFMVTDPPTSPPKQRDQLVFGAITGAASYAVFAWVGAVHFLLSGVLVGNVWEALRRSRLARRRAAMR